MKVFKILYILLSLFMMGWAFVEQTKTHPNVWVQIAAVVLFFYGMMKLTAKASSKSEDNKTRKTQDDVE